MLTLIVRTCLIKSVLGMNITNIDILFVDIVCKRSEYQKCYKVGDG